MLLQDEGNWPRSQLRSTGDFTSTMCACFNQHKMDTYPAEIGIHVVGGQQTCINHEVSAANNWD